MSSNLPADQDLYTEAGITCAKLGEDEWCIEAPEVGPIIVKNRRLADKIFQMAHRSYWRGRSDAFGELRRLIGAD